MNEKELQKKIWMENILREELGLKNLKRNFHCINPEHEDYNPSMSYDFHRGVVHCFGCGKTYDVYDLLKEIRGFSFIEAKNYLESQLATKNAKETETTKKIGHINIRDYISKCEKNFDLEAETFALGRSIQKNTIRKERIGYDPCYKVGKQTFNVLIFPYGENTDYYIARSIEEKRFFKPSVETAGEEPLYHQEKLRTHHILVVTESVLDCLSIEQESWLNGVALNGTGYEKLLKQTQDLEPKTFILCLDEDKAGQKASKELSEKLRTQGHDVVVNDSYYGHKDANELLVNSNSLFREWIEKLQKKEKEPHLASFKKSVEELLTEEKEEKYPTFIQTQWKQINDEINWQPGSLTVLGGIPSSGKTTFSLQLAESFSQTQKVIYISLEQSVQELIHSISTRREYQKNLGHAISSLHNLFIYQLRRKTPRFIYGI